jgi:hypothetical protein
MDNTIDVVLLGTTAQVRGKRWPSDRDGQPSALTAIESPCELALHLPSGRTLRLRAHTMTLSQRDDKVSAVTVLPLANLVSFPQAAAEIERLAAQLGVADKVFDSTLARWREQQPAIDPRAATWPKYMVKAELEPQIDVYSQIKSHASGRGWFIALEFSKSASARP